jgi:hypothetical protein
LHAERLRARGGLGRRTGRRGARPTRPADCRLPTQTRPDLPAADPARTSGPDLRGAGNALAARAWAEALETRIQKKSLARLVADGFLVGIGNPRNIVFFAAVLPQFVDRRAGHIPGQLLLLGAVFAGIALLSDSGWALAAGSARA